MKTFQNTFLIFIFLLIVSPIFSQETSQDFRDKMGKTLAELSSAQRDAVLKHAITLVEKENLNKAIARVAEQLSKEDQEKLLQYALMEKYVLNMDEPIETVTPLGPQTLMTFEEPVFDFGEINEGDKVSHIYKFKNTGSEPLIIIDAKGSCGCTVPQWPKEPIAPGETAEMLIEFNSKGKSGLQHKRVTVTANTNPAQTFISIKGEVLKDKQ